MSNSGDLSCSLLWCLAWLKPLHREKNGLWTLKAEVWFGGCDIKKRVREASLVEKRSHENSKTSVFFEKNKRRET